MQLVNWIKKPYFFINSPKLNFILCFGIGLFIFLFLYLFQPFNIASLENNLLVYTLGFGVITFVIQAFYILILPYFFQAFFDDEKWTVGKNILYLFLLIFTITFGNWYYNSLVQITHTTALISLKEFFFYTFSVSILPIVIFTYLSEKLYTIHRKKVSKKIMEQKFSNRTKKFSELITIFAENNKDSITFNVDDLIYITCQSNYASIFINTKKGIKEKIIRSTLIKIATELNGYDSIKRCHKSFIINTRFMNSISGNARGYFLKSKLVSLKIPISRNFKKQDIKSFIH